MCAELRWPFDTQQLKNPRKSVTQAVEKSLHQRSKRAWWIKTGFKSGLQRQDDGYHAAYCHDLISLSEIRGLRKWWKDVCRPTLSTELHLLREKWDSHDMYHTEPCSVGNVKWYKRIQLFVRAVPSSIVCCWNGLASSTHHCLELTSKQGTLVNNVCNLTFSFSFMCAENIVKQL